MPNTSSNVFGHGRPPIGPNGRPTIPLPHRQPVEATVLGKKVEYKTTYDPTLLVAVPRQDNRNQLNIKENDLPFIGYDIWNAYEVSCITEQGIPMVFIGKIQYPANSGYIVESKSLKLYLNSFNMTATGRNETEARILLETAIRRDLSNLLKTEVEISLFTPEVINQDTLRFDGIDLSLQQISTPKGEIKYNEDPSILKIVNKIANSTIEDYYCNQLRSNCKVTHQPDWGTVCIHYMTDVKLNSASLFEYIISFRNENHFHEEICETIYTRLYKLLNPSKLCVACFYTRRGGIDINPIRATDEQFLLSRYGAYIDTTIPSPKTARQ